MKDSTDGSDAETKAASPRDTPKPPRKGWLVAAGLLLGVAAGLAAVPALIAWGFLHPPRRLHRRTPRTAFGADYERIALRTSDGILLSGWYIPAPKKQAPRGIVVVCHGYYGNRQTMLPYLAFLHRAGYATIAFDFRAHGWSGGSMATFGRDEIRDLHAALDWIEARPLLGTLPLALLGESMGAAVALLAAADDKRVRAVVADSPFARFDLAVEGRLRLSLGPAAALVSARSRRFGERLLGLPLDEIAPVEAMPRVAPRPVLLVHGTADRLIGVENSRQIQAAAPESTTLWEVPDSAHVRSVYDTPHEYARRVTEFLDRALREKNGSYSG